LTEPQDYTQQSYRRHAASYDAYSRGATKAPQAKAWLDPGTVNGWRMARMYRLAAPLLETHAGAQWLTVGDGRYGLDAIYLAAHGARALPTDISGTLLEEARQAGLITDYRVENAESLSFPDAAFDFVLCKESYHHFPRPMKALYEMLRVARRGVLLIEPCDHEFPDTRVNTVSRWLKNLVKGLLGRPADGHRFEELGNYVYGISRRELSKVALGAGYPTVAFKGLNDAYFPGVEFERAEPVSPVFRKVRDRIARYDRLCALGVNQYGLLGAAILRLSPDAALREALARHGFDVIDLPKRPRAGATGQ